MTVQPPIAPPRDALTEAQVTALIRDTSSLRISAGCELVDLALNVVEDITNDLVGGSVARSSYATLHGTGTLAISRDLDWGSAIVRPYLNLDDGTTLARFNLGAYYTSTPRITHDMHPHAADVECYDILSLLNDIVADVYAVTAGTGYLAAVETILVSQGVVAYLIDQASAAAVLPADRVWIFDDQTTWLTICNDLLASIGYQGIWSDWDGRLRIHPYESPRNRAPEWVYDTEPATSMLAPARTVERDYFAVPNRWVFYRSNQIDGDAPVEGDGIYSFVNENVGDTSVEARGRTITRAPIGLDVADHASLVAAAQVTIDADMQVPTKVSVATAPNPLHWHFDRCYVVDHHVGPPMDVVVTQWSLPLDGSDMQQSWTVIQ